MLSFPLQYTNCPKCVHTNESSRALTSIGSIFAYVYPSQTSSYRIYLCKAFWNTGSTGTDSRMVRRHVKYHRVYHPLLARVRFWNWNHVRKGTLIHELSHFDNTADTSDYAYGQTACRDLAKSSALQTINNADSHEYIAENTPVLACKPWAVLERTTVWDTICGNW